MDTEKEENEYVNDTFGSKINDGVMVNNSADFLHVKNHELTWKEHEILTAESYKKRVWKNIILISFVFFMNFLSFGGLSSLQSTLHIQQGMGVICTAILYTALVISCLFVPKPLIFWLGHKWVITISLTGYILWMFANGYGVWATMIPASIAVGICGAPLWTAQCAYFAEIGKQYAAVTNQEESAVISLFFGVFFLIFQSSGIFGNIISSTILHPSGGNRTKPTEDDIMYCGINDCPGLNENNTNLEQPSETVVWTLCGVYIVIAIAGFIISAVFVDNLPVSLQSVKSQNKSVCQESTSLLASTVKHMGNKKQLLLIPLTVYSGLEQTFKGAEFSKSWVSCTLGIWMIGLVNIPYGICDALMSFFSGRAVKLTGRLPIFILGLLLDTCIQITLSTWQVDQEQPGVLFTLSSLWGVSDGIWQTQINSLYGVIFIDSSEAAFSNYRLWESMGFIIGNGYSHFLCTTVKLAVLFTVLWLGIVCYCLVEWMERKEKDINLTMENVGNENEGKYEKQATQL